MAALNIYLFGDIQVIHENQGKVNLRPMTRSLLAYLLLYRHQNSQRTFHRREMLVNHFWADHNERQARRCLSTTLWRLRSELEFGSVPRGTYLLTLPTGEVSFNFASDHWIDVIAFEENIHYGLSQPVPAMDTRHVEVLEEARQLYTGELLEDRYDDWIFRERERLNLLYLNCLVRLMRFYEYHGIYEKSLACAQEILAIDPLREQVHRHIMKLYLKNGQRTLAVQQYKMCEQTLGKELGIQPMPETQALYMQIVSTTADPTLENTLFNNLEGTELSVLEQSRQQLQMVMHTLDETQAQLQQIKQMVSHLGSILFE